MPSGYKPHLPCLTRGNASGDVGRRGDAGRRLYRRVDAQGREAPGERHGERSSRALHSLGFPGWRSVEFGFRLPPAELEVPSSRRRRRRKHGPTEPPSSSPAVDLLPGLLLDEAQSSTRRSLFAAVPWNPARAERAADISAPFGCAV